MVTESVRDIHTLTGEESIDLFVLARAVWRRKLFVAAVCGSFIVLALWYLRVANYTYTTELQVTAAQSSAGDSLFGNAGGLSNIASLAGIDLRSTQTASPFQLYLASLHSREVSETLSTNMELMTTIFSGEWDRATNQWKEPQSLTKPVRRAIKAILGIPNYPWQQPDGARLQDYLAVVIKIKEDPKSPVVKISLDHPDPAFARRLLSVVHEATDAGLRRKAGARTRQYINYLSEKLDAVTVSEHRLALAETLSEQEKLLMVINSTTPYAAEPFGKPASSVYPTRPRPVQILIGAILAGIFIAVISAVLTEIWRHRSR